MPIKLSWLIPDKILLSHWSGEITVQDMQILVDELGIIFDAAPRLVHSVIDLSETQRIQDEAAYYYFRSPIPSHPRRGRVALVQSPFQGIALADVFNRVSQREMFRVFDSRESARDFLLHHDTFPPDLNTPPDTSPPASDSDGPGLSKQAPS